MNREAEAAERQRKARIEVGIDWTVCMVPGCGDELRSWGMYEFANPKHRDPDHALPLCTEHSLIVWRRVQSVRHESDIIETNEMLRAREQERLAAQAAADKQEFLQRTDGDIYFVKLNGLIKVGWSRSLPQRLRAYGPDVEVLCHYEATRHDETNLHRQLTPYRAQGREWYEDCRLIRDLVAQAIQQHGPPYIRAEWTKPTATVRQHAKAGAVIVR